MWNAISAIVQIQQVGNKDVSKEHWELWIEF